MLFLQRLLRWRAQQKIANPRQFSGRIKVIRLALLLFGIILLHTLGMVLFESMHWWDGLWLTLTTATTVGYGDLSAHTPLGRIATIFLLYGMGIYLLAQLVSEYIEYRFAKRERKIKGLWEWKHMHDHILIINTPKDGADRYLERLVKQLQQTPSLAQYPIQLLTRSYEQGLPQSLNELNVVHYHGRSENPDDLKAVHVERAKYIFLVARDEDSSLSDCLTFDILAQIESIGSQAVIVAEAVEDSNRKRFIQHGARCVIRPIRAYPELVARTMDSPGVEQLLENLFSHDDDHPRRFDIALDYPDWKSLASKIIHNSLGTPMGYITHENTVRTNPNPHTPVKGKALLLLVHQNHIPSVNALKHCLST